MTSPAAGRPLLTATRLTKTHHTGAGQVPALHDVSFDLDQGTFYVLTGPSGSGKSTLLSVLAGWDTADTGALTWSAHIPHPASWRSVAVVPQSLGLLAELTIGENVALPARLCRDREPQPTPLLERLGVGHLAGRYPAQPRWESNSGQQSHERWPPGPASCYSTSPPPTKTATPPIWS